MTSPPLSGLSFEPTDEPLDDVLVVDVARHVVHIWSCQAIRPRARHARWSHDVAGLDDAACSFCLPDGLPDRSTRR